MTFRLTLYDRNGIALNLGDIVKISDGHRFTFYSEVKYLAQEKTITPFHTFSFSSIEKVDKVPDYAIKSTEERYDMWYLPNPDNDENGESHRDYLMSWRECEHNLRAWTLEPDYQLEIF